MRWSMLLVAIFVLGCGHEPQQTDPVKEVNPSDGLEDLDSTPKEIEVEKTSQSKGEEVKVDLYVIYKAQTTGDYPNKWVLRKWTVRGTPVKPRFEMGDIIHLGTSLKDARDHLPPEANHNLGNFEGLGEDPSIEETWIEKPKKP